MKKIIGLLGVIIFAVSNVFGQTELRTTLEPVTPHKLGVMLPKTAGNSAFKTSATTCRDTVWYTYLKAPGAVDTTQTLSGFNIFTDRGLSVGQLFPGGRQQDTIRLLGAWIFAKVSDNGLLTGAYADGDTIYGNATVFEADTAGGSLSMGNSLGTGNAYLVVSVAPSGTAIYLEWMKAEFPTPIDVTNTNLYAITFSSLPSGGNSDSLLYAFNMSNIGAAPPPHGGILEWGGSWDLVSNLSNATADYIVLPIVEYDLTTSFTLPQDTVPSGTKVTPNNTSHMAYLSPIYNFSVFTSFYYNALGVMNSNLNGLEQLVPIWSWGVGSAQDFAFPDTAWYIYTTTKALDSATITLTNQLIPYSNGSGCPLPNNPQNASNKLYITGPTLINGALTYVAVYPNPASDFIKVELKNTRADIALYNLNGQKVAEVNKAQGTVNIPVSSLPNGTYVLKVNSEGKLSQAKINIRH